MRRKQTQAAIRREAAKRQKATQDQLAQLGRRLDEVEQSLDDARRRADGAEQRALKAEARVARLDKRLVTLSRLTDEATDRSQRAMRIPTRLKDTVSRTRKDR